MSERWTPQDYADYQARRSLREIQVPPPDHVHFDKQGRAHADMDRIIDQELARAEKQSKYRNKKTEVDGIVFDSKREATRYQDLKVMQDLGLISGLTLQPKYPLEVNGVKICTYKADFLYFENGKRITEDTKGVKTPAYRLKKKLMLAIYGIAIRET